jgi:hypothetical protein
MRYATQIVNVHGAIIAFNLRFMQILCFVHVQSCDDTELFSQLLERHLLASVVTSPFYPRLVSYILDCQATADVDDQPSHLRIEVLSSQLTAAGFHAEAKALVTQYQRMYPQHARSGDNTFSKLTSWFKR